jgi:hypothetical protein
MPAGADWTDPPALAVTVTVWLDFAGSDSPPQAATVNTDNQTSRRATRARSILTPRRLTDLWMPSTAASCKQMPRGGRYTGFAIVDGYRGKMT